MKLIQFQSAEEVIAQVASSKLSNYDVAHQKDFSGRDFASWTDALEAARSPWPEGAEEIRTLAESLVSSAPTPKTRKRRARWSEDNGDELDRTRLYDGSAPWRTTVRQEVHCLQSVVIAVDVSANAEVRWYQLKWRGVAAIALADILEKAGYSVEIHCVRRAKVAYIGGVILMLDYLAKSAGDPVSIDVLASSASTWFYRTVLLQYNVVTGGVFGASSSLPISGQCEHLTSPNSKLVEITKSCDSQSAAVATLGKVLKDL